MILSLLPALLLTWFPLAAPRDLASIIPAGALTAVEIADVESAGRRAAASPWSPAEGDSGPDPLESLRSALEEGSPEAARILAGTASDAECRLTGVFASFELPRAAWSPPPKGGKRPKKGPRFVLGHYSGPDAKAPDFLGRLAGGRERTRLARAQIGKHAGWRILIARPEKGAAKEDPKGFKKARTREEIYLLFARDGFFLRGPDDPALMAGLLDRAPGGAAKGGGLASRPGWRGARSAFETPPDAVVYRDLLNLSAGGEALIREEDLGRGGDVKALGLDEIKGAAAGVFLEPGAVRIDLILHAPAPRRGLARLLWLNRPIAALEGGETLVPPDALAHAVFSAKVGLVWSDFRKIMNRGAPSVGQLMDGYLASLESGLGEGMADDLAASLGDRWIMFARPRAKKSRAGGLDASYAIGLAAGPAPPRVVDRWLRKTASLLNYPLETSEARGAKFYRMSGAETGEGAAVDIRNIAKAAVTPKWLLLSSRFEHMEAALARERSGAPGSPRLLALTEGLPPDRFLEIAALPEGAGAAVSDPFLGVAGSLLAGATKGLADAEKAEAEEAWRGRFAGLALGAAAEKDNLRIRILLKRNEAPE